MSSSSKRQDLCANFKPNYRPPISGAAAEQLRLDQASWAAAHQGRSHDELRGDVAAREHWETSSRETQERESIWREKRGEPRRLKQAGAPVEAVWQAEHQSIVSRLPSSRRSTNSILS